MCMAVPSRVVDVDAASALVDTLGTRRRVSVLLLDEPVAPGDWVLVRMGEYASERIDEERAREALAFIASLSAADAADVRAW